MCSVRSGDGREDGARRELLAAAAARGVVVAAAAAALLLFAVVAPPAAALNIGLQSAGDGAVRTLYTSLPTLSLS